MYKDENHIMKFLRDTNRMRFKDFLDISKLYISEVEGNIDLGLLKDTDITDMQPYEQGSIYETRGNKYHIFKFKLKVSPVYQNKPFILKIITGFGVDWHDYCNPNFLLFVDGKPVQAFDTMHRECIITYNAKALTEYECFILGFSGMRKGPVQVTFKTCTMDIPTDQIYYDVLCPFESIQFIESDSIKNDTRNFLINTINMVDFRESYSDAYYESIQKAHEYLKTEYYEKYCDHDTSAVQIAAIGNTHIDVVWEWPLKETRQKALRSFTTQLKNMREYENFKFIQSQPQLYKLVKQDYPDIYEGIKKAVKEGKWEPEGALWLETDCNLVSGESFIRQLMHGKRFFKQEFGVDSRLCWLPDVFGYSAAMPQLLKKSGVDYFSTSKISWSEFNVMPYNTFMWEGIDGSQVFTNFIAGGKGPDANGNPRVDYTAHINAEHAMGTWKNYRDKGLSKKPLWAFGLGDGGGGPSRDNLEQLKRFEKGIKGMPKVKNMHAIEYFDELYDDVKDNPRLRTWVGELYLEYHRGTYTTLGKMKKNNRMSEILLRDGEAFNAVADRLGLVNYDKKLFYDTWETVLLNQFHDALPGASVKEVYDDADIDYARVIKDGKVLLGQAIKAFSKSVKGEQLCVVFNQLAFKRFDTVKLRTDKDYTCVYDYSGNIILGQTVTENNKKYFIFEARLSSFGYTVFKLSDEPIDIKTENFTVLPGLLENEYLKVTFDDNMNISSLYDKDAQREVVQPGQVANRLIAFEDKPLRWQAHDIEIYYSQKPYYMDKVISSEITEDGPVRKTIRVDRSYGKSRLTQFISLERSAKKIDFATLIDNKEDDVLLKAAFPVDVHANEATYEIQFGNVKRPTHWNTSWDYAKFEVCAHKWADLSEDDYGVSILNDCKYGHDIKDSVMRLTLMRSPTAPYAQADHGHHEFTYSIYPHAGDFKKAHTVDMAYKLNYRPYAYYVEKGTGEVVDYKSYLQSLNENVVVETVKKAEDSDAIILRVYECFNRRTQAEIEFGFEVDKVIECDLMENDIKQVFIEGGSLKFEIRPYEIKTFKLI